MKRKGSNKLNISPLKLNLNKVLEPRTRPFGTPYETPISSFSSFFGLEILLNQEKSSSCLPPKCLTISLEVIGGFIGILGIVAVSLAFTVLTGAATPVVFGIGSGVLLIGLGLFCTGIARHCDYKSILNDEPDNFPSPRNI